MTHEEKAQALIDSPVGCALILDVFENRRLPLEHFADPKVSFWLAASAMDFTDPHATDLDGMNQLMALKDAKAHEDLAMRIVAHPSFAWWYEPIDLTNQVWASSRMPYAANLHEDHNLSLDPLDLFDGGRWEKPAPPSKNRHYPHLPPGQKTSTLRDGTTSEAMTFALTSADFASAFPLAVWKVNFHQNVRVREINHPADWHELCLEFPYKAPDGRIVPDWLQMAKEWDGIHLTLGGMLSCKQNRYEQGSEWSMLQSWHTEQTNWLNRLEITANRMPDIQRSVHWQELTRYPYNGYDPFTGLPLAPI